MLLFRALKRIKTAKDAGYDRHDLFVEDARVHCWAMNLAGEETVTRREFASAAKAVAWFKTRCAELKKADYVVAPPDQPGWTVGPKGQRRYVTPQGFTSLGTWGASVRRFTVEGDSERTAAAAKTRRPKPERRADLGALRALVIDRPRPSAQEPFGRLLASTNTWFAALVKAGLDLEPMAGASAKTPAVRSTGPYSKAALAAFRASLRAAPARALRLRRPIDWSGVELPENYVEVLRQCGALAVLTDFRGPETMFPLVKVRGWPLSNDVKRETDLLQWEVERHGEPGSFSAAYVAGRRWLRVAANAPGGSDHFTILDLNRTQGGAAALYRVDDTGLPTRITARATTHSFKTWLVSALERLHVAVAESVRSS